MSEQRLSEKNTEKFRKKFPDLSILEATTWGHSKALWCEEGLFITDGVDLEKDEDWDGHGHFIGISSVPPSTWKEEYGENYEFNPGDINEN